MFPGGGGSSITIQISGDASGLRAAVVDGSNSINQLGQSAQQAGDGGFNAFQRFAITLNSIADLARNVVDALSPITDTVTNLIEQMFQLNVVTEKNVYSWQYLFGGGAKGKGIAANMAEWTSQFSMQVPFTRQDLISAVSTLSTTMGPGQIQQFMPILADITSTMGASAYGGQGMTLAQGAYALMDFMMGRSRMFTQEFHIKPEDLIKYGLKGTVTSAGAVHIQDPSTIITALQRYDQARGLAGGAQGAATQTWWGEWSSFIDRIQNFGLQAGGTDLNGNVRQGSMFGEMKKALDDISKWMDDHADQIKKVADIISQDLAGAFKTAAQAASGLFTGLQESGLLAGIGITPTQTGVGATARGRGRGGRGGRDYTDTLDVTTNAPPQSPWQQFGETVGNALQTIGNDIHTVQGDIQGIIGWFNTWHDVILSVAGVITGFFVPAMLKAGVEAVASAAQITANFIASIIKTGVEGWIAADKILAFVGSMILSGAQAIAQGAIIVAQFIASMIKAGVEATVNGGIIIAQFVAGMIKAGAEAVVQAAIVTANWIKAMVQSGFEAALASESITTSFGAALILTGTQAVANGAKVTANFIASMVKAGAEAVTQGAQVTGQFVASMVKTGAEAVTQGAQVTASFIASMIKTGAEAVANAAKVTGEFVASMVKAGAQALVSAGQLLASIIPAIISLGIQAAATAVGGLAELAFGMAAYVPIAWSAAAATIAATWPFILIGVAVLAFIGLIILVVTHWKQITTELGKFKDGLAKDFGEAWKGLGTVISNVWDGIKDGVKNAINWIIDRLNDFIHLINKIHISIPAVNVGPVHTGGANIGFSIPDVPHLAAGGRILRAGMAIVGERGEERVWLNQGAVVEPHEGFGPTTNHRYGDNHTTHNWYGLTEQQVLAIMARQQQQQQLAYSATRRGPGGGNSSVAVSHGWGAGRGSIA